MAPHILADAAPEEPPERARKMYAVYAGEFRQIRNANRGFELRVNRLAHALQPSGHVAFDRQGEPAKASAERGDCFLHRQSDGPRRTKQLIVKPRGEKGRHSAQAVASIGAAPRRGV